MMMILFWNTTKSGKKIKKLFNPKENIHYSCIAAISIDSVIKLSKENYPQVNLEQCKFRFKNNKSIDLFDDELEVSSDESEIEAEWI